MDLLEQCHILVTANGFTRRDVEDMTPFELSITTMLILQHNKEKPK